MPVAVVPSPRLVRDFVNVAVPNPQHSPAHEGSRLRVEPDSLTAYLAARIHGLSMWVRSKGKNRIQSTVMPKVVRRYANWLSTAAYVHARCREVSSSTVPRCRIPSLWRGRRHAEIWFWCKYHVGVRRVVVLDPGPSACAADRYSVTLPHGDSVVVADDHHVGSRPQTQAALHFALRIRAAGAAFPR